MTPEISKLVGKVSLAAKKQKAAEEVEKTAARMVREAGDALDDARKSYTEADCKLHDAHKELWAAEDLLKKAIRAEEGL